MREVIRQPRQDQIQLDRVREKVEILNGERGNKADQAVRMSQLSALIGALPEQPTATDAAGSAPTAQEYATLLSDVRALYSAFNAARILIR